MQPTPITSKIIDLLIDDFEEQVWSACWPRIRFDHLRLAEVFKRPDVFLCRLRGFTDELLAGANRKNSAFGVNAVARLREIEVQSKGVRGWAAMCLRMRLDETRPRLKRRW